MKPTQREPVKVTQWMKIKAKATFQWQLTVVFLKRLFNIREYAYAIFTYEEACKHKSPKRKEFVVLARISRNAPTEEVKKKLFTLKPEPDSDCTLNVVGLKIKPIKEIKVV